MPSLRNPRHERLAQALAEGKSQAQAYIAAGYSAKSARANASVLLKRDQSIVERVLELLDARREADEQAFVAMVQETKVNRLWIERQLIEVVERAMQSVPVLKNGEPAYVETPDGKLAPAYTFDANGAVRALHLLGLERGMFRHRIDPEKSPLDDLPAPVLKQFMDGLLALRKGRTVDDGRAQGEAPFRLVAGDKGSR